MCLSSYVYIMECERSIMSSVNGPAVLYLSTLSDHNDTIIKGERQREKVLTNKMRVFVFLKLWNISHSKKNWASNDQNIYWSSRKVHVILVWRQSNCNFLSRFSKKEIFMKSCQVGIESFQADRHDVGNSSFSQLYKCTYLRNAFV